MLKILMIAPTPFFSDRGCHVRIYEEAHYLLERGHQVLVVTYPVGDDPPGIPVLRLSALPGYERREAGPAWSRLWLDGRMWRRVRRLLSEFQPSLVHAHLHEGCLIAALSRTARRPIVFDYQGSLTGESIEHGFIGESGWLTDVFRWVERRLDLAADRIIVSADTLAAPLKAHGLKVTTVRDGVDTSRFSPGPPDPGLRKQLDLPPERPVLVYLGALTRYQGTDLLLNALSLLQEKGESFHALLMGYPEGEWKSMAQKLGLRNRVTFTGRLDYFQAPAYLRLGLIALAPKLSRTESNGKVLNYMACGLPVIAFDLPVNRELLAEEAELIPVSPDRTACAEAFAEGISRLLADSERRARLAETGRRRVLECFSMEHTGAALLSVYQEMLSDLR